MWLSIENYTPKAKATLPIAHPQAFKATFAVLEVVLNEVPPYPLEKNMDTKNLVTLNYYSRYSCHL